MINGILKRKVLIPICFLIVTLFSLLLLPSLKINYDLMDYLPKDAPSTIAAAKLEELFGEINDTSGTRVMVRVEDVSQALELKSKIAAVTNVSEVKWLDDTANINQPLSFIPEKQLDAYYKEGWALYQVKFSDSGSGKEISTALSAIREIISDEGAMSGGAVNNAAAKQNTGKELQAMMLWLIPIVLVIMLFSTGSWFEPVLFLLNIGIAILINTGTNVFLGSVSFVTQTSASVLQLAVSMDYSIFLLHAFGDFRKEGQEPKAAMKLAMKRAFPSIIASAATTIIGFLALCFMRFLIGADMGIVLAKGVTISLLSVVFLLPVLTLIFNRLIEITRHRPLMPGFQRFARFAVKAAVPVAILMCVVIVPAFLAQGRNDFIYGSSAMTGDENSIIGRDDRAISERFGKNNQMVLIIPHTDFEAEQELAEELLNIDLVTNVSSYATNIGCQIPMESIPEDKLSLLISKGYSRMVISVNSDQECPEAFTVVERIRETAAARYEEYYLTGSSVNVYDMREVVTQDNTIVNIAAIIGIALVILFTFRSLTIPVALLASIEVSIWLNLSFPYFSGNRLIYIGYIIISAVQLGATVDYAILLSSRYMEKRKILGKREAATAAIRESTGSILTSAGILAAAGIIISQISTNGVIAQLGELIGRGAAISAFSVLFFLPSLLMLLDKVIRKTTLKANFMEDVK
jgi:predicted RND superfamily exporter protein